MQITKLINTNNLSYHVSSYDIDVPYYLLNDLPKTAKVIGYIDLNECTDTPLETTETDNIIFITDTIYSTVKQKNIYLVNILDMYI